MKVRPLVSLINPNTDVSVTRFMLDIATDTLGAAFAVEGRTVQSGPAMIIDENALSRAAHEVVRVGEEAAAAGSAALLIAAFGDPGVATLARQLKIPVTGIAEAAITEAIAGGRRFSIVTTTPLLKPAITALVAHYDCAEQLAAVRITPGRIETTMATAQGLAEALLTLCRLTIVEDSADAIIIGGGPLALAARAIESEVDVPLIEPVSAGARLAAKRVQDRL